MKYYLVLYIIYNDFINHENNRKDLIYKQTTNKYR